MYLHYFTGTADYFIRAEGLIPSTRCAGKGFAVVADEIRKLAESSGEQSKTIGSVLKKIKSSIDKITRSTENVLNKFEAIDT